MRGNLIESPVSTMPVEISVVVPVYNSAGTIPELCKRLHQALAAIGRPFEMVLVNDDLGLRVVQLALQLDELDQVVPQRRRVGGYGDGGHAGQPGDRRRHGVHRGAEGP